jgi:predicted nucleic acid-binding protein/tellurite resistance protein
VTATPSVILDTNVLVAAGFRRSGAAARIVAAIRRGDCRLVWNDATRRENEAVLRRIPPLDWNEFSSLFGPGGEFQGDTGPELFGQIEDPEDRKFAALAAATGATVISADAHLLFCRDELPIAVLTAREFLSMTGDMPGMAAQAPPLEGAATQVRGTIMSFIDSLVSHLGDIDIEADALPALVPAVIAAGVLIAFADGAVESRELEEIDDEALKCLMGDPSAAEDIHHVVGLHMSNFDRDPEYGHDRALAVLADFASDAPDDQKITVMNAALHIARACHHGDLTPPECEAAREVAKILKVDLATFGL